MSDCNDLLAIPITVHVFRIENLIFILKSKVKKHKG